MTSESDFYATPEAWQDGAMARAFKPDPYLDKLLAEAQTDPGAIDRLDTATRTRLGVYQQFKAGAARRNHPGGTR